ncbi:MAG TPA: alpha/beta fold hydrolase [Bacteroidia bacterium]|nr:alpha/beta fold hydrolase [Bacteroidia bacterium]
MKTNTIAPGTCILLLFLMSGMISCLRLDDNLFNQNKLSQYNLDRYTGEVDFTLNDDFAFPDSLVHLFTLNSRAPDETQGTSIYAIYIGDMARIATDTVIMYCHGNKDHMDFYWPRAKLPANTGWKNRFGVMMIDYRGFGMSEGKPTEQGLYADVDAALKWLQSNGLSNNRLVIYGFSMGSAPATKLTAEPRSMTPSKLMLEAPFANAETMVQDGSGLALPGSTVTDLQINNAEEIKHVTQPFFWIHGEDDDFLNIDTHGAVVYANYSGSYKEAHRIPAAGHSTVETTMGFAGYLEAIESFVIR